MIRVNCAAIPHELFESEFFGHVKGSFTGAVKDRAGRFELADGGTIFLDEVGEIPLELQSKLLRVLQEGECQRVGEDKSRQIDVRVIAATNKDLKAAAEAQEFREDLYYRLNVFPLEAAPLRERKEDIPLLASYFIELISKKLKRTAPKLTTGNIHQLQTYDWPGNIRELQNLMERAIILSVGGQLSFQLPGITETSGSTSFIPLASEETTNPTSYYTEVERHNRDRNNILAALNHADWKISGAGGAAELLEIKPTTLTSRMKTLGIDKHNSNPLN
jgi:transcriptional regulator with GAF, ATPase, and Fis domain